MQSQTDALFRRTTLDVAGTDRLGRRSWYVLFVFVGISFLSLLDRQMLSLAAAPIEASLKLSDSEMGTVQGLAFAIFTVLFTYPVSWLADRFELRSVLIVCIIVWSGGTIICGLATNSLGLFVGAIAIAAGEAGVSPILLAAIPQFFPGKRRTTANAIYLGAYLIGGGLSLMLGGYAIGGLDTVHADLPRALRTIESWRLAFFLVATPSLLLVALTAFLPSAAVRRNDDVAAHIPNFIGFARKHWKSLLFVYGAMGTFAAAFTGCGAWLPAATTRSFSTTAAENGFGVGVAAGVGSIVGVLFGTVWMRRGLAQNGAIDLLRIACLMVSVMAPFPLILLFVKHAWEVYLVYGVMMIGGGGISAVMPMILQEMAPAALRTRTLAVYTITNTLIAGSAPMIVGALSVALGPDPRSLLTAITLLVVPGWIISSFLFRMARNPVSAVFRENDPDLAPDRSPR